MIRQHISGAVLAIVTVLLFAMLTEDQPVISYARSYSTYDVHAGDVVEVDATVTRDKSCSSAVRRDWIDQNGQLLVTVTQEIPDPLPAGQEKYTGQVVIPLGAEPGPLIQRVRVTFYCNFVQRLLKIGSDFVLPDVVFNVKGD